MPETKLCPFCAEEIKNAAIVCKHCGRDLPDFRSSEVSKNSRSLIQSALRNAFITLGVSFSLYVLWALLTLSQAQAAGQLEGGQFQAVFADVVFSAITTPLFVSIIVFFMSLPLLWLRKSNSNWKLATFLFYVTGAIIVGMSYVWTNEQPARQSSQSGQNVVSNTAVATETYMPRVTSILDAYAIQTELAIRTPGLACKHPSSFSRANVGENVCVQGVIEKVNYLNFEKLIRFSGVQWGEDELVIPGYCTRTREYYDYENWRPVTECTSYNIPGSRGDCIVAKGTIMLQPSTYIYLNLTSLEIC